MSSDWPLRIAASALALAAAIAACYDEVPGPQGPLPARREAPPLAPRPQLTPPPSILVPGDARRPILVPTAAHLLIGTAQPTDDRPHLPPPAVDGGIDAETAVVDAGPDAGIDGPTDLPLEIPDAGPDLVGGPLPLR